ncbi:MAG TPA: VOC family protein [Candidatus Thermoplasmatota archaeon]|nr:VOC family protein [Candidatus Thermoplasmatota archaeon]
MAKATRSKARKTTKAAKRSTGKGSRAAATAKGSRRSPGRATATLHSKAVKVEGTLAGRPMHSVTGQLIIDGAKDAIAWYGKVFGAKELDRKPMPDGRIMHAVLQIGDTLFMLSDPFQPGTAPKELNGAYLHVQDKGIDAMWDKALAGGAKPLLPLANQFWGDRYGQLRDPFGQMWSFGWPAKMTAAEQKRLQDEANQHMATMA